MSYIDTLKTVLLALIEGITEWLPVSSTGHILLFDYFFTLSFSPSFKEMFFVVIQLAAIMAVIVKFWSSLFPFAYKEKKVIINRDKINTIGKVIVSIIPSGVIGLLFDDYLETNLHTPLVIASTLIIYGIIFILIEKWNKKRSFTITTPLSITYKDALIIGLFQVLSLIPGTSRSGATIIGALLIGINRESATEFTFYMAIPTMLGASLVKIVKFGLTFTQSELFTLLLGSVVSFIVSLFSIKFLLTYVKKNDFTFFGIYRIVLGLLVLLLI